jgi:hypothetical protein
MCGHTFCFECLIGHFGRRAPQEMSCPQCDDLVYIPPVLDERAQAAVCCLRRAEGDEAPDMLIPPDAFDRYFWP